MALDKMVVSSTNQSQMLDCAPWVSVGLWENTTHECDPWVIRQYRQYEPWM